MAKNSSYNGNPKLKKVGVKQQFTQEQFEQFARCSVDPIYFIEKFCKIVHLEKGLVPFDLRDYQKDMVLSFHDNRETIVATARQVGKSVAAVGYVLWYVLFNKHKQVAILANKGDTAQEILGRVQLAYEHLPQWIQQGVVEWNKTSFELENGCKVLAAATSSSAIRGFSINMLIIDEAAHIDNWDEFFSAVYPTISSGETTKIVLISTPNGLNHFHKIYSDAQTLDDKTGLPRNTYHQITVKWHQVPGRTEEWMKKTLANMGYNYEKFAQEYEVEFVGSSGTLISGIKLKMLNENYGHPVAKVDKMIQYERPIAEHQYVLVADTSRGKGLDYSAFQIIDVSQFPFKEVCTYRNNLIISTDYAGIIFTAAKLYNNALVLVEINDLGGQVVDTLHNEYEYEDIIYTANKGRAGKTISGGYGTSKERGIRTTTTVKATGCAILKMLIEQDKLQIIDPNTIEELNHFSRKNNSYEAEEGHHDDMVMGLVLFAWMSDQTYFKNLVDNDIRQAIREMTDQSITNDMFTFGWVVTGIPNETVQNNEDMLKEPDYSGEMYEDFGGFRWYN